MTGLNNLIGMREVFSNKHINIRLNLQHFLSPFLSALGGIRTHKLGGLEAPFLR